MARDLTKAQLAQEDLSVDRAMLASWQRKGDETLLQAEVARHEAVIRTATDAIAKLWHDFEAAPAQIKKCEAKLAKTRQNVKLTAKGGENAKKLSKLAEMLFEAARLQAEIEAESKKD